MFSYLFGYDITEPVIVKSDNWIDNNVKSHTDEEEKYKSIAKNYELNKQIRRVATKLKLNKVVQNKYVEDESYLDMVVPLKTKRIVRHKRSDSQESIYEVLQQPILNFEDNIVSYRDTEFDAINISFKNKIPRRR